MRGQRADARASWALLAVGSLVVSVLLEELAHAELSFGVVTPNLKVRPRDKPALAPEARLKAARNEFEAFQVVFLSTKRQPGVSVIVETPLAGPDGARIPTENITLYRVAYYDLTVPSNNDGAPGPWPDPLVPDVDTYVGERRNAFPFIVPAGESRVVWVDVLVPLEAKPGWYEGALGIQIDGRSSASVPIRLLVGNFELPSTATLKSAFRMDYSQPCVGHTGVDTCDDVWNERAALELRRHYVRAALEHRFTIPDPFFQPPVDPETIRNFEDVMLGFVDGSGNTRLPGARLTTVHLDAHDDTFAEWLDYAKRQAFYERLHYYPVDEPEGKEWDQFRRDARALHALDRNVPVLLTVPIQSAEQKKVADLTDILVVEVTVMEGRPEQQTDFAGNQRSKYDAWLAQKAGREVWLYQGCSSHGCGECGDPSPHPFSTGWPNRAIDSVAVTNRAQPWMSFTFDAPGELYYETTRQLGSAWDKDGQCGFSGHGDGTLFYPGLPARIGGRTDIPIESIRMKLIREGMEDYEYLTLVARKDRAQALQVARDLFPHMYETSQPPEKLERARDALFALLVDGAPPPPSSRSGGDFDAPPSILDGEPPGRPRASSDAPVSLSGTCAFGQHSGRPPAAWLLLVLVALFARRSFTKGSGSRPVRRSHQNPPV